MMLKFSRARGMKSRFLFTLAKIAINFLSTLITIILKLFPYHGNIPKCCDEIVDYLYKLLYITIIRAHGGSIYKVNNHKELIILTYKRLKLLIPQDSLKIFKQIFIDEIYEQFFKVKKGDVVIDVGAHVGIFTVKAGKTVGTMGLVIALEPENRNFTLLHHNIRSNNLDNVILIKKAAGATLGKTTLYISPHSNGHSIYIPSNKHYEVEVTTLDNIVNELGIKNINYVKIDAEGAEIDILEGMRHILNSQNDLSVVISAYHKLDGEPEFPQILYFLKTQIRRKAEIKVKNGIIYVRIRGSYDRI
ncbi:MAG: FkbM family methyltransferase [archaeon YNP-LCB-003-016]|uniref:FkbM family methyltransferase n=1 Tax=Candidatus Culexarchaeum yellowstonense TaxID=2928963 RepID=UPI0026EF8013|nr:FkbM family methyltransferase [Candidatus Culexarchaeum yellowstonense]MCR6692459.1 FkbM family methyltransferase [Candidatus Culexarchaeum yellowstonense]